MVRRVLAGILCAAMIFSSESFSMAAMAAPIEGDVEVVAEMENSEEDEEVVEEAAEETQEEGEKESETADQDSEQAIDEDQEEAEDASTEEIIEEEEQEIEESADEEGVDEEEETEEAEEVEEIEDEAAVELEDMAAASACFSVGDDGVLVLDSVNNLSETATIPKEAKKIPAGIFNDNKKVKTVKFEDDSELVEIAPEAFKNSGVVTITIPDGVTEIPNKAFMGDDALVNLTLGAGVTNIGESAFQGTGIKSLAISHVKTIGENAFSGCKALKLVTGTSNVEKVMDSAFAGCSALETFSIPSKLNTIGSNAFSGTAIDVLDMSGITADDITIGSGAFADCKLLTDVYFPMKLIVLNSSTFKNCVKLEKVKFSDSDEEEPKLTTIGSNAFEKCSALEYLVFPETVSNVQTESLKDCLNLKKVTFKNPNTDKSDFYLDQHAFPNIGKNLTLVGYDGVIQDVALNNGFNFVSSYEAFSLSGVASDSVAKESKAKFAFYVNGIKTKSAKPGDYVIVEITPDSGYTLDEGGSSSGAVTFTTKTEQEPKDLKYVSTDGAAVNFGFTMRKSAVELKAYTRTSGSMVKDHLYVTKVISIDGAGVTEEKAGSDGIKYYAIDKVGQQIRMQFKDEDGRNIGPWLLNFSSSNEKAVSVSETGIITAREKIGKSKAVVISATYKKNGKNLKMKVYVKGDTELSSVELKSLSDSDVKPARITTKIIQDAKGNPETVQVVEYKKDDLRIGYNRGISVTFDAKDVEENSLKLYSEWKSADKAIAYPEAEFSLDNSNRIVVKNKSYGESLITITISQPGSTTKIVKHLIIRVVDARPRLSDTSITVNTASAVGRAINVVPVYGYQIYGNELTIVKKDKNGNYVSAKGLDVEYNSEEGKYYIKANDEMKLDKGKTVTYKDSTKLYLKGYWVNSYNEKDWDFVIGIPELKVTNKPLAPKATLSGSINLFYQGAAPEAGKITVTQSLSKEKVIACGLLSTENYKKYLAEETPVADKFANNFTAALSGQKIIITRTDNALQKDSKGKAVVSGYLGLMYEGYSEPVFVKIKVTTKNVKPNYVLSLEKATINTYKENQTYPLQILNAKTKKAIVLDDLEDLNLYGPKTTAGLFKDDITPDAVDTDTEGNDTIINLSVDGLPKNGKAVIYVKKNTWEEALLFTFTLKTTTSMPKAKLTPAKVTVNTACPGQGAEIKATLVQAKLQKDAELSGFAAGSLKYAGERKYAAGATALMSGISCASDGTISVELPSASIPAATYKFKVTPTVKFSDDGAEFPIAPVTFQVVVNAKTPTISLKNKSFTVNSMYPGAEVVTSKYTLGGVPAGSLDTFDTSEVVIKPAKSTVPAADTVLAKDAGEVVGEGLIFDEETGTIGIKLNAAKRPSFEYEYKISGLKAELTSGDVVTVKEFSIKIKGVYKAPSISLKAKSSVNPIDPTSAITYTATIKNTINPVESVVLKEYLPNGTFCNPSEAHFAAELVSGTNKVKVTAKPGTKLNAKLKYQIVLVYTIKGIGEKPIEKKVTIEPKQVLPKIKVSKKSAYLYAGQANQEIEVKIETTGTTAVHSVLTTPVFAPKTSEEIKKAYKIKSFDAATGIMTLELVNPSAVKMNKEYTVEFETRYENQMEKSQGNVFKLKLTVKK